VIFKTIIITDIITVYSCDVYDCTGQTKTRRNRSKLGNFDKKMDGNVACGTNNGNKNSDQTNERRETAETETEDKTKQDLLVSKDDTSNRTSQAQKNLSEEQADDARDSQNCTDGSRLINVDSDDDTRGKNQSNEGHGDIAKKQEQGLSEDDGSSDLTLLVLKESRDEEENGDDTNRSNVAKLTGEITENNDAHNGENQKQQVPENECGFCSDEVNADTPSVVPDDWCVIDDGTEQESFGDAQNKLSANHAVNDTSSSADLLYKEAASKVKARLNQVPDKLDDDEKDSILNSFRFFSREKECEYICPNCCIG